LLGGLVAPAPSRSDIYAYARPPPTVPVIAIGTIAVSIIAIRAVAIMRVAIAIIATAISPTIGTTSVTPVIADLFNPAVAFCVKWQPCDT
jgi:hypothetical protein